MAEDTWPGVAVDEAPATAETSWPGSEVNLDQLASTTAGVKGRVYGPVVGETHHDAMYGPTGRALGENDVALSPDLLKQYPLGSNIISGGKNYTVADVSFVKPGHPNTNTIEFRDRKDVPDRVDISPSPQPVTPQGEEMKDLTSEIKPIKTYSTRRAHAVNPADEPWPGIEVKTEDFAPTMEKQTVTAPEGPPVEPDFIQKTGNAIAEYAKGFIPKTPQDLARMANIPTDFTDPEQLATFVMPMLKPSIDIAHGGIARAQQIREAEKTPAGSQERYNAGIGTVLDLAQLASLSMIGRAAPETATFAKGLPPAIDEVIGQRVQKPWDMTGIDAGTGDFIDVPFVRMSDGTLGDRVSAMLTPQEGQRPARAILLHPGEKIPPPLLGYPTISHVDGSTTVYHPPPSEEEMQQVIDSEPSEVMGPDAFETPTPEELLQPTMTAKQFDAHIESLARSEMLPDIGDAGDAVTSPVTSFIMDRGGLISKTAAKKAGHYDKAPAIWDDVPKDLTSINARHLWNGTELPDNMAQGAYDAGLIPSPDVGSMWTELQKEKQTQIGARQAATIKPSTKVDAPIPPINQVRLDMERLGLSEAERKILDGKHYVVADTTTGDIRDLFGTREEAMQYLHEQGQPGEAAFKRDPMTGDNLVGQKPHTVDSLKEREIVLAGQKIGRRPKSGADWDEVLKFDAPETDAQRLAREKAESQGNEQVQVAKQKAKDAKMELKLGFKARKLRGGTGDLGQADMMGGGDLFAQPAAAAAKPSVPALTDMTPEQIQSTGDRILGLNQPEDVLNGLKKLGYSKNAQKIWDKARYRDPHDTSTDYGTDFYEAAADDIRDWEKAMKARMKRKGQSGAINLDPLKEYLERRGIKDTILARAGAVDVFADTYSRQRANIVRYDFGTVKDALTKGTKAYRDLEALSAITEAGGNKATLAEHRKLVASAKPALAKKWTPVWDYALREFDRLTNTPNHLRSELDRQIAIEKLNGTKLGQWTNYIPHMFAETPKGFMFGLFGGNAGGGGLSKWFTKTRQYNNLAEAIHGGEDPKSMNAADLAQARIRAGQRLNMYQAFHKSLQGMKMPDGSPVAVDAPSRGYQTITIQGVPIHVHPEMANYVAMLFDPSAVRRSALGRVALKGVGLQKSLQLGLDTFHAARLSMYLAAAGKGITRVPRAGYRRGLASLELAPDAYQTAINSGEFSPEEVKYARVNRPYMQELIAQGLEVSKFGDNITGDMKTAIPGTRTLNTFIFDHLGRGALMTAGIENFKRNIARFPELTRQQAARKTVIEMNEMFGNIGRKSIFKSNTFRDLSQFLLLARNWVESQAVNEARAYGQAAAYPINVATGIARSFTKTPIKGGSVSTFNPTMAAKSFGRLGVTAQARLTLALGLLAAGQIINMVLNNGKTTFQNEKGKKLAVRVPLPNGHVYYFDPAQIPFEYTHQVGKYIHQGEGVIGAGAHIAVNKLSKLARGVMGATTGRTYIGGAQTDPGMDRVRQVIGEEIPLPIVAGGALEPEPRSNFLFRLTRRPDAAALQAAASTGFKLDPEQTATQQMYGKLREHGMDKPGGGTPGEYSQLKRALANKDVGNVETEVGLLMREANTRKEKLKKFDEIRTSLGLAKFGVDPKADSPPVTPLRFTGAIDKEIQFKRALKPEERTLYNEAQADHAAAARMYLRMERRLKNLYLH
jgi:hypothetical protein